MVVAAAAGAPSTAAARIIGIEPSDFIGGLVRVRDREPFI
jgi:hypothetical protein